MRATLLKTIKSEQDCDNSVVALQCGKCSNTYSKSSCCRRKPALQCALCRLGVKGSAILCFLCGHGGHVQHMRIWFETDSECATGCGCQCLHYGAAEF